MGLAVPPERHRLALSPLNRRRWQSFKANRRGYWAFWIFMVLFVLSLFAEFIANDKPFFVRFEGRSYFPVFGTYPETAFGGEFETAADYRDPYLQKLIAEKGGFMLWPPIRYSYNTHNLDLPTPAPSKPTWLLTEAECKTVVAQKGLNGCSDLEYNWLGTDDRAATWRRGSSTASACRWCSASCSPSYPPSSALRRAPCRAISAAGPISCSSASSRSGLPSPHSTCCSSSRRCWCPDSSCCSGSCCCSPGCRWSVWCVPNFCAGAISNTSRPRARSACRTAPSCSGTSCPTPWSPP